MSFFNDIQGVDTAFPFVFLVTLVAAFFMWRSLCSVAKKPSVITDYTDLGIAKNQLQSERIDYITNYQFPKHILEKLSKKSGIQIYEAGKVAKALKEYFIIVVMANGKSVAMPSVLVDELWHEFIINTKLYRDFCDRAFGKYLDHNPIVSEGDFADGKKALNRTWVLHCQLSGNIHRSASKASDLFTIDDRFGFGASAFLKDLEEQQAGKIIGNHASARRKSTSSSGSGSQSNPSSQTTSSCTALFAPAIFLDGSSKSSSHKSADSHGSENSPDSGSKCSTTSCSTSSCSSGGCGS